MISDLECVGKGAWQQWLYEVEISNVDGSTNRTLTWINTTQVRVGNLSPGVLYRFHVRGTSAGGAGPWSDYFVAQTLRAGKFRFSQLDFLI